GEDTTHRQVREQLEKLQKELARGKRADNGGQRQWTDKDQKDLENLTVRYRDLCLMDNPTAREEINDKAARIQGLQESLKDVVLAAPSRDRRRQADELAADLGKEMARLETAARPIPALVEGDTLLDAEGKAFPTVAVVALDLLGMIDKKQGRAL